VTFCPFLAVPNSCPSMPILAEAHQASGLATWARASFVMSSPTLHMFSQQPLGGVHKDQPRRWCRTLEEKSFSGQARWRTP
jgi:hypothetical protein